MGKTLTEEQKAKMKEGAARARAQKKASAAATATNAVNGNKAAARKHAALIDSIVLNGASFLIKDAALKDASRLLKTLSK